MRTNEALSDEQRRELICRFRKACLEFRGGARDDEAHAELIAAQTALYAALASAPPAAEPVDRKINRRSAMRKLDELLTLVRAESYDEGFEAGKRASLKGQL